MTSLYTPVFFPPPPKKSHISSQAAESPHIPGLSATFTSTSSSNLSQPKPAKDKRILKLSAIHVALSRLQPELCPPSPPRYASPDPTRSAAVRTERRVEQIRKQVHAAVEQADGERSGGKWGQVARLLRLGCHILRRVAVTLRDDGENCAALVTANDENYDHYVYGAAPVATTGSPLEAAAVLEAVTPVARVSKEPPRAEPPRAGAGEDEDEDEDKLMLPDAELELRAEESSSLARTRELVALRLDAADDDVVDVGRAAEREAGEALAAWGEAPVRASGTRSSVTGRARADAMSPWKYRLQEVSALEGLPVAPAAAAAASTFAPAPAA
ncbi:hypothetical protein FIBSPDRAFT_958271 [Athelia psychrophila]|uniref:Uncharacterized protein n=1 Tax=Athelia psychrophila TaxID=1759441 RepID=A0A166ET63_9AGAM|nr:hypothetical protein FIBSPDRAFT_958271 [Fibularhizoctonia sp. CBS 109695]